MSFVLKGEEQNNPKPFPYLQHDDPFTFDVKFTSKVNGNLPAGRYDLERKNSILKLKLINQSSAQQRKGRAGRKQQSDYIDTYQVNRVSLE